MIEAGRRGLNVIWIDIAIVCSKYGSKTIFPEEPPSMGDVLAPRNQKSLSENGSVGTRLYPEGKFGRYAISLFDGRLEGSPYMKSYLRKQWSIRAWLCHRVIQHRAVSCA